MADKKIKFIIDLKPALNQEKLEERILRDFSEMKNKGKLKKWSFNKFNY